MSSWHRTLTALALVSMASVPIGVAQRVGPRPDELQEVGIEERAGELLPLELEFVDEAGQTVKLGDYFGGERPVILTLGYYRCPMLCGLVWNGLVTALEDIDWNPGEEFELVTVSINPEEGPELATAKKANYVRAYGRPGAEEAWHFLTGDEASIKALADSAGFHYRYVPEQDEYAHTAALILVSPDGKITRYLHGVMHDPKVLRLSLVESAEGKIGSPLDRITLFCFRYDHAEGEYTPAAMNLTRALLTLLGLALGTFLFGLWRRERRKKAVAGARH